MRVQQSPDISPPHRVSPKLQRHLTDPVSNLNSLSSGRSGAGMAWFLGAFNWMGTYALHLQEATAYLASTRNPRGCILYAVPGIEFVRLEPRTSPFEPEAALGSSIDIDSAGLGAHKRKSSNVSQVRFAPGPPSFSEFASSRTCACGLHTPNETAGRAWCHSFSIPLPTTRKPRLRRISIPDKIKDVMQERSRTREEGKGIMAMPCRDRRGPGRCLYENTI
ncbi:hypothetical protein B0H17DRAFT_1128907 [Mycena rosella]|uniref:Uncharacterized protein n=1 Tax=Mycena rosella TaxID=1033263 RepID=A0AAD7DXF3_MYCRO|nr:hypothetical protein B0H17DRAFT_1128907 [Mycena rosella]